MKNHSIAEHKAEFMLEKYSSLSEIETGFMQGITSKYILMVKIIPS